MGNREEAFPPSPAHITEFLTLRFGVICYAAIDKRNMSNFHLWQKALNSGLARSGSPNGSFGPNRWAEVSFTFFLSVLFPEFLFI